MKTQFFNSDWSKSFMFSVHQTHFLIEKRLEKRLTEAKSISFSQFLILLALNCNKEASQRTIATFLHLTEATVSRHITQLEKIKYLVHKENPSNRRKHILSLTPLGTRVFNNALRVIERELKDLVYTIPETDRARITKTFDEVMTKLQKHD